ncbi:UDP-GlcNAc:betaGal beta-1,3-N-acetylglucosaminyltransferase-like protein 1 isoform X4 [Phacochoerus africanus]|uniref:UDP-GlcNAc:betaGal beta-1,3-N-acetylglucosaminyltransferase-like protein 1 isoform X4 n=1 Tax=Phacochoerus africanus TaxID=41426 RepID=UPI001FDA47D1|nr:UDP-GlcNAc:betaGal beta-1,3-N-acetylglucosaminyltransferase-like protein 1 isoform X4 [Phacochoerus africanus]XP_047614368.1 UDP-GlcNAc:betaGal beta-1,3-N-acetylglucosaminyltransferase-like protein 1 isoform X4 [Phacochoerus africanus]XP_047614370.1 UDP-GlcNAc:betaGal beta-1,3-N-acetylglucosaminyltransferase-like protein 1 isoform X4 [Phacochoerus africanus]
MQARGDPAAAGAAAAVVACGPARAPAQVSVILPVHNAEPWLDECLGSVLQQDFEGRLELSIFNDASKDKSMAIIEKWKEKLEASGILVVVGGHDSPSPRGVGYSKNQAVAQSSGAYLCFLDSDDVMMPQRVRLQHAAAAQHPTSIIGCQVQREPPDSTQRYTRWLNQLEPGQLLTQAFTSHGPTVPMPTWFCSRAWFSHVGPFDEGGRGVPEDLLFFYEHLRKGGGLVRVDRSLLVYRYHPAAATHAVLETTIWTLRVRFLEEQALPRWATFTIWNAGRQGRRLYRSLTAESRHKVVAFCDVDENKIQKGFYCHEESQERPKPRIPVLHFRAARPPFVICVKLFEPASCTWHHVTKYKLGLREHTPRGSEVLAAQDLTGGAFEDNLRSLHLREGRDFLHFS